MSWDQNVEWRHNIMTDNSAFERVQEFRYLGTTLMNQNSIQEEIKSKLKSRNTCCHSVQNICLQLCYQKIQRLRYTGLQLCLLICMAIKLGHLRWGRNVVWGCGGEYLGLIGTRWKGTGENYIMRNLLICTPHRILSAWSIREGWDGRAYITYGGEERCIQGFGGESWGKIDLEEPGLDGRIKLRWFYRKWDTGVRTGLIWPKIGTRAGGL